MILICGGLSRAKSESDVVTPTVVAYLDEDAADFEEKLAQITANVHEPFLVRLLDKDFAKIADSAVGQSILNGTKEYSHSDQVLERLALLEEECKCDACGYEGQLKTYLPCEGYNDIRCPKCRSTNNQHNREYMSRVWDGMNGTKSHERVE